MLSSSFAIFVLTAHAVAANYTFDLFQGITLQDDTASKAPSELYYTTGGGVECVIFRYSLFEVDRGLNVYPQISSTTRGPARV